MVCATENTHFSARVTRCLLGLGLAFPGRMSRRFTICTYMWCACGTCGTYTRQTTGRNKYTGVTHTSSQKVCTVHRSHTTPVYKRSQYNILTFLILFKH